MLLVLKFAVIDLFGDHLFSTTSYDLANRSLWEPKKGLSGDMGKLYPLVAKKGSFVSFGSSYMFVSAINEISMLENPYLDTKIARLADLKVKL